MSLDSWASKRIHKVLYGVGYFAAQVSYQSFVTFVFFFYVDVLRLNVQFASLGWSIYGLWNAINDPIAGYISDRTRTRWGRRIPYIAFGAPPLAISYLLVWIPSAFGVLSSDVGLFLYFTLTILLFDTIYTFTIINWIALFPEMYLELTERAEAENYVQIFGVIGLIAGMALPPLIYGMLGWQWLGIIIGILTLLTLIVSLFGSRERPEFASEEALPLKEAVKSTLANKTFLLYVMPFFLLQFSLIVLTSVTPFYAKYVLELDNVQTSIFLLAAFLSVLPALALWSKITVSGGTKKAFTLSMMALSLALIPLAFAYNFITGLIIAVFIGIGLAGNLLVSEIILAEIVDEDELNTGKRREGMYYGIRALFMRSAIVLEAIIVGAVLTYFGYIPDLIPQPPMAVLGIRLLVSLIPVSSLILGILVFIKYPLSGERLRLVKERLEELHRKKRMMKLEDEELKRQ
ncbi:MAG: MFS transporter [Candidatus Bathyarchaeia archaeon]